MLHDYNEFARARFWIAVGGGVIGLVMLIGTLIGGLMIVADVLNQIKAGL